MGPYGKNYNVCFLQSDLNDVLESFQVSSIYLRGWAQTKQEVCRIFKMAAVRL